MNAVFRLKFAGAYRLFIFVELFIFPRCTNYFIFKSSVHRKRNKNKFFFSSYVEKQMFSSWIEQENWFIINFYNIIRLIQIFLMEMVSYPMQSYIKFWI